METVRASCADNVAANLCGLEPLSAKFVVSNLMKLDNPGLQRTDRLVKEVFWTDLRDLLLQLRQMQLICCPNSGSHVVESRISQFNDELKKTYEALSGAIHFHSFYDIGGRPDFAARNCDINSHNTWYKNSVRSSIQ